MIYPYEIPNNVESQAEKAIFNQLSSVKDIYDIFYSKSFLGRAPNERKEYEIDFIIAEKPKYRGKCSAIFCLEVKGGIMEYNGESSEWLQNGFPLKKGPDKQASSASHSLHTLDLFPIVGSLESSMLFRISYNSCVSWSVVQRNSLNMETIFSVVSLSSVCVA